MESLLVDNTPKELKHETIDKKEVIEMKAKLEVLEMVGGLIDSLREAYTRQLIVNDIKDENELNNKIENLIVSEKEQYINDCGKIEP